MPASNTPKTQREFIDYRFDETNKKIDAALTEIKDVNKKLDDTYATKDFVIAKDKNMDDRVSSLESDRQWLVRAIVGMVILGAIAFYLRIKS